MIRLEASAKNSSLKERISPPRLALARSVVGGMLAGNNQHGIYVPMHKVPKVSLTLSSSTLSTSTDIVSVGEVLKYVCGSFAVGIFTAVGELRRSLFLYPHRQRLLYVLARAVDVFGGHPRRNSTYQPIAGVPSIAAGRASVLLSGVDLTTRHLAIMRSRLSGNCLFSSSR